MLTAIIYWFLAYSLLLVTLAPNTNSIPLYPGSCHVHNFIIQMDEPFNLMASFPLSKAMNLCLHLTSDISKHYLLAFQ